MYGRVVNKHARHNLCFADYEQDPDYENKKGRVVKFEDVPLTKFVREKLKEITELDELYCQEASLSYLRILLDCDCYALVSDAEMCSF